MGRPWQSQPRHVGRVLAAQTVIADDDVLEDFVQGGADVDIAIGERWPVVQDKAGLPTRLAWIFPIEPPAFPLLEPLRFALDQDRPSWRSLCAANSMCLYKFVVINHLLSRPAWERSPARGEGQFKPSPAGRNVIVWRAN